jgi:hypothetical protein
LTEEHGISAALRIGSLSALASQRGEEAEGEKRFGFLTNQTALPFGKIP